MAQVPTGSTFHIATVFAAVLSVTAVSNATEAVVSCATHNYSIGDIVEITSGWGRLNLRIGRVKSVVAGTSFVFEGFDTTNTTFYPAGGGIGSVRKISTFQQITMVTSSSSSGGDPKQVEYKYIESDVAYTINDGFAATGYAIDLDADAISTAGYAALKLLTEVQTNTVLKILTRSGSLVFQPCTVALNESLQLADGQINKVKATFNGSNRLTRYAS